LDESSDFIKARKAAGSKGHQFYRSANYRQPLGLFLNESRGEPGKPFAGGAEKARSQQPAVEAPID